MHQTYVSTYLAIHCLDEKLFFLVSLTPDHVFPSGGFSLNTMNLVKPVHASDNSLSPTTEALVGSFPLAPTEIVDSNISLQFLTMSLLVLHSR